MANPASSVVNLTLAVTDQLTPAITNVGKNVVALTQSVGNLTVKFAELSIGTASVAAQWTQAFLALPGTLASISQLLDQSGYSLDAFATRLEDVSQYSFKETAAGLGDALGPFLQGAIPQIDAIASRTAGIGKLLTEEVYIGLDLIDKSILSILDNVERRSQSIIKLTGNISNVFGYLSGVREPLEVFDALRNTLGGVSSGIFNVVQEIGFFSLGLQGLQQLVNTGPFQALIGQNEQLRQQLLSTQSTLAATSNILQGGTRISDPTQAIQALESPVKNAIAQLREGSLDLVGVTSKELVPVFQIVTGQVSQLGVGLDKSVELSLDFAAALGTLGIPLYQANEEIRSILTGTADQNTILYQSLQLNNEQLKKWREQGVLVDKLRERLSAFRAGNALAAQSISGITSNIQEIFDEITRAAGEPLMKPIVAQLDAIYKGLKENRQLYTDYIGALAKNGLIAVQAVVKAIGVLINSIGTAFSKVPDYLFKSLANAAVSFTDALTKTLVILQPFINLFAKLAESAIAAGGPFLNLYFQFKTLQLGVSALSGGFGTLAQIIPGLGELMFFLTGRSNSLVGTFLGLRQELGYGAAGFLLMGKNLASLPGLFNLVARFFPLFGNQIAGTLPLIASFGIALTGASRQSAIFREVLQALYGRLPGVATALSGLASANGLPKLAELFGVLAKNTDYATTLNEKFGKSMVSLGTYLRNFVVRTVLVTGAIVAVAFAFDQFILKNEYALKAIQGFVSFTGDVARSIGQFLINPFTLAAIAATGLAVAIQTKTIPALHQLIAAQLVGGITTLATKLRFLADSLAGIRLAGMAASATQAAQGFTIMATAASAGAGGLSAFAAGLGQVALGLAGLLAPLALVAAGIGAIGLIRYTIDLKESTEAFEIYRQQSNAVADNALAVASKLKAASDRYAEAQRTGIALSNEEIATNAKLVRSGKLRLADLEEQIKVLQLAQKEAVGDEIRNAFASQLAMLEATRKALEQYLNTVQIAPRSLPELGNAFDQLKAKAEAAQKAIANPSGDIETFKKKVEEYQTVTQQQVAIGAISLAEAENRYRNIASLSALEADVQIKAAEAAVGARKEQLKQESDLANALIEQRRAAIAAGSIDEYAGNKDIFKIQKEDLERQKKSIEFLLIQEAKAGRGRGKIARDLYLEKQGLETQLTQLSTEELNKRLELENRYLDTVRDRINTEINLAETEAQRTIQGLYNQREITQAEADERRVNLTRDRLARELALEMANLEALQSLPQATDPQKQEEQERAIRASRLKTAQITTQLSEQQQREQEAIAKVIQERISREQKGLENLATRQNQAYEKQLQLLNKLNGSLEQQNRIIESRKDLTGAIGDYLQTEYKILIETAKTDQEKQRLTQKAAQTELRFLAERQRLDRESLEIKLQLRRAEDDRLKIESKAAELTAAANINAAQAEYAKAKANPQSTPEELDALRLSVEAAVSKLEAEQAKGKLLGAQATFNRREESTERRKLALQQAGELDQKRYEYGKTLPESKQEDFFARLRKEIFQRLSGANALAPSDVRSGSRRRYTPTTYDTLGRIDPKTGEYIPAPRQVAPLAGQVASVSLPSLKEAQMQSKATLDALREQLNLQPTNNHLQSLVGLQREGNQILLTIANDPKMEIQNNTYQQTVERSRSTRGLPR
jgi:hypothetical protein